MSKRVDVRVAFDGIVHVRVPDHLSVRDAKILGHKYAIARMLATTDNPDAPEEEALEEYQAKCSAEASLTADADWDHLKAVVVGGRWESLGTVEEMAEIEHSGAK